MMRDAIRVEIKRLYSLDLPGVDDSPTDPANCWIRVNVDIGPVDSDAADTFRFVVTTPARLQLEMARMPTMWGRDLMVVREFAWEPVEAALTECIDSIARRSPTWEAFVERFICYAAWEFEDFRE